MSPYDWAVAWVGLYFSVATVVAVGVGRMIAYRPRPAVSWSPPAVPADLAPVWSDPALLSAIAQGRVGCDGAQIAPYAVRLAGWQAEVGRP